MVTEEEKQQAQSIGLEPEVVFNTLQTEESWLYKPKIPMKLLWKFPDMIYK